MEKIIKSGHSVAVLVLGLGIFLLFWEVPLFGYVQVPADLLYRDPVFSEAIPDGYKGPNNDLLFDHIYQFYVWHHIAQQGIKSENKVPLWNPYILGGQPLVANSQSALFYPPMLLLHRFSPGVVATVRAFFNIFVAGFFTYLFCRELAISSYGALLSSIAFAFSGAVTVGPGHPYANSLVWLPFIMWSGEKILSGKKILFWSLVCSFGVGLSILGGHLETTFHILFVFGVYSGYRILINFNSRKRIFYLITVIILVVILGLVLGAIQWVPFMSHLMTSDTASRSRSLYWQAGTFYYSPEWLPNLTTLVTLVYPNFFGNPADKTYQWPFFNYVNYLEQSMYFGIIPFSLAVGVIFEKKRKRPEVIILTFLALFTLMVALRLPGFEAINYLPGFMKVNNTRLRWVFSFLGAVLAGFGLDGLRNYLLSGRKNNLRLFRAVSAIFLTAILILAIAAFLEYFILRLFPIPFPKFIIHLLGVIFSWRQFRTVISIIVIFSTIFVYIVIRNRPSLNNQFLFFLITITFIELIVMARGFNTTVPKEIIIPNLRLVRRLKGDADIYRIMSLQNIFWPNFGAVYGLQYVGGYDVPTNLRYAELYNAQGGFLPRDDKKWSPDWPLIDWMNVKYLVTPKDFKSEKYELFISRNNYDVYRNNDALPRAYLVNDIEIIHDPDTAKKTLVNGDFDFRRKAILEYDLPLQLYESIKEPRDYIEANSHTVEFVDYQNDKVVMDVITETPGVLVMSDVYSPGWKAELDGNEVDIYLTNYAFRGVYIPEGEHRLVMFYDPWEFDFGSKLTVLGFGVLILGLPITYRLNKSKARNLSE